MFSPLTVKMFSLLRNYVPYAITYRSSSSKVATDGRSSVRQHEQCFQTAEFRSGIVLQDVPVLPRFTDAPEHQKSFTAPRASIEMAGIVFKNAGQDINRFLYFALPYVQRRQCIGAVHIGGIQ